MARLPLRTSILAFLLLAGVVPLRAQPQDAWLGVYLMGNKLGYNHLTVGPTRWQGKPALKIVNSSRLKISILGQATEQTIDSTDIATPAYRPLFSEFAMSSMGRTTRVKARFEKTRVVAQVSGSGSASTKVVPIPKGVVLGVDPALALDRAVKPGTRSDFHYFNAASLAIEKASVSAQKREAVSHGGVAYQTVRLAVRTPMGEITAWQDDTGELIRMQVPFGLEMWKETREQALEGPKDKYAPPADIASATAVKADREIEDPREKRYLKLRMTGLRSRDLVSDDRQKAAVTQDGDSYSAILEIRAPDIPTSAAVSIRKAAAAAPAWTKPSTYVQSTDPQLVALARKILGGETNALRAALKLRDWVHENMSVRSDIALIRSSLDVLKDRVGVCRDYAVLYAGLARAAGIPTRIATGLVYADGAFYYHAWNESYVGRWIDIDATAPTSLVDATHIKFARGDVDTMFGSGRFVGQLQAQIQEVR